MNIFISITIIIGVLQPAVEQQQETELSQEWTRQVV